MGSQRDDKSVFVRRAFVFLMLQLALGLGVLSRLVYLQIFRSAHYSLLSDRNRLVSKQVLPSRGSFLDSEGYCLAKNRYTYSAVLDLFEISPAEREAVALHLIDSQRLDSSVVEKLKQLPVTVNNENRFILLQEDLDWQALSSYYIASSKIPGVIIEKYQTRSYPYSEILSHVIGYTGSPTKGDIEKSNRSILALPTAKIGKTCLERWYNDDIFGRAGIRHIEVNSRRQFVRDIDSIAEVPGDDIHLTLNLNLQLDVYKILSQCNSASCVVMDANTGAILSLVSYPGYDPNIFTKKVDQKSLTDLYRNPYMPMINKVISGLYSPGSVFKMMTALAGLKKGVITENTKFHCSGCYELGKHKFHCWRWKYGGHGYVNLEDAIAESCDVYFYNVARLLSPDDIASVARDFGLGAPTGIDLPNEKSGLIPTKAWKREKKKQPWTTGDTFNMSIGQGFVLTTPLQLAKMTAMLVNGQRPVTPHLKKGEEPITLAPILGYNEQHIRAILNGMNSVVNSCHGTARNSAIDDKDFMFGGKTGSSQVFRITEQLRREGKTVSDDYWKKEHAVFVGYAPVDNPKIVVSVLVEHGGGGSSTAAPIARDVLLAAKKHLHL